MTEGRPQDQSRRHRKRGAPSPETASLLARWHATLRRELEDIIVLMGTPQDDPRRDKLVARGVVVARELGTEVDAGSVERTPDAGKPQRQDVDFGT